MHNEYKPYSETELYLLMNEPWEVSDRPYLLHAAYALSCLFEVAMTDEDEYDVPLAEEMWGRTVPEKILNSLVYDITTSFNDAAVNHERINVWNRMYSVRKQNAYDHKRIHKIFDFPLENGEYRLVPEGVLKLFDDESDKLKDYNVSKEEFEDNKLYLRRIITLAEDDKNDGWNKLTDMEVAVYCWGLFYARTQSDNFTQFQKDYKDFLYENVEESDLMSCWNRKATLMRSPNGMYTFSAQKIREWNDKHGQKSIVDKISKNEAEDYWYNEALLGLFKPRN